jgi:exonuclease SbcC
LSKTELNPEVQIDFETLKKFIEGMELKLKGLSFDDEQFSLAEKQFNEAQAELKQINDSVVTNDR